MASRPVRRLQDASASGAEMPSFGRSRTVQTRVVRARRSVRAVDGSCCKAQRALRSNQLAASIVTLEGDASATCATVDAGPATGSRRVGEWRGQLEGDPVRVKEGKERQAERYEVPYRAVFDTAFVEKPRCRVEVCSRR